MSELEIYDTDGNVEFPAARTGDRRPEIAAFTDDDISFGVRTDDGGTVYYLRFRARGTASSRSDPYYARYPTDDAASTSRIGPFRDVADAVTQREEHGWGREIEDPTDDLLKGRGLNSVDVSDEEISVLERLLETDRRFSIEVPTPRVAIEIVAHVGQATDGSAAYSRKAEPVSGWDLIVRTGPTSGVKPGEEIREDWEHEREKMQMERIEDELESVRNAVDSLGTEHGLTTEQIRKLVYDRSPELRPPERAERTATRSTPQRRGERDGPTDIRRVYLILVAVVGLFILFSAAVLLWGLPA